MDDQSWDVRGIDPDLYARAAEEAARRGIPLGSYIAELLTTEAEPAANWRSRRLAQGLASLEAAAGESAHADAIHRALRDIRVSVAGLERAQETANASLAARIDGIASSVEALEEGRAALKQAVASDFMELAEQAFGEIDRRLNSSATAVSERDAQIGAVVQHVAAQEQSSARAIAGLLDRLSDAEREFRDRIHALTLSQHKSEAALTSEIAQLAYGVRGELDGLRAALQEAADGRTSDRARIDAIDGALDRVAGELALLRTATDQGFARATDHHAQIQRHLTRVNADWDARFDALATRLSRAEEGAERDGAVAAAEFERIEACTFAALQKLSGDIATVRSAGAAADGEARARLETVTAAHSQIEQRLAMLESAASRAETEQALTIIRDKIAALSEAQDSAAHRLDHAASTAGEGEAGGALGAHVRAIEEQLTRMEQRHAHALDMLRAQLAQFAADNEQRLSFLESTPASGPDVDMLAFRLARLEQRDIDTELQAVRTKLDERLLDLEARSIGALERLGDTIADLERRVLDGDAGPAAQSA